MTPLFAAVLAMLATSAHANWVIMGPNNVTVSPGESGSSVYQFVPPSGPPGSAHITSETSSFQVEGSGVMLPITAASPITQYSPNASPIGETITAATPFQIIVDWTISSNPAFVGTEYAANYSIGTDAYGSVGAAQNIIFAVVATPEPAQIVAGSMLLGCGVIVFASRRLLRKKTAVA